MLHKTVTHSASPVCCHVRNFAVVYKSKKKKERRSRKWRKTQLESHRVLSLHRADGRIHRATGRTAISLFKHSCNNGLLSLRTPPGYKDMHSCCSAAQKLNVMSGIPPFHKQDSVTAGNPNSTGLKLDLPISAGASKLLTLINLVRLVSIMQLHVTQDEKNDIIAALLKGGPGHYWVTGIIFPSLESWTSVQSISTKLWAL